MFEPVLLDLSDDQDIHVLTVALSEFALNSGTAAREIEDQSIATDCAEGLAVAAMMQRLADRAHVLLNDIELQMARNGAIRAARHD